MATDRPQILLSLSGGKKQNQKTKSNPQTTPARRSDELRAPPSSSSPAAGELERSGEPATGEIEEERMACGLPGGGEAETEDYGRVLLLRLGDSSHARGRPIL
jgi:hypothetical protein